jgi:hypothetical protein
VDVGTGCMEKRKTEKKAEKCVVATRKDGRVGNVMVASKNGK